MGRNRNVVIVTISAAIFLILTQFQNCAPPQSMQSDTDGVARGEVRIVEDWAKAELRFVAPEVELHDEVVSTDLQGFCHRGQNGSSVNWKIWAGQKVNDPLLTGQSTCVSGQFAVKLEDLENMVCGVPHILVAEGSWGASAYSQVIKRCQPLMTETVSAPLQSPYGTKCSLEYSPGHDDFAACSKVCYRDQKMVFSQVVELAQCSTLAAKLAGP